MIKISTLFKKNPEDLGRVINEINPENQWVFDGEGVATRKFDGTAAMIKDGILYKRYDVKKGREVPANATPCQEPDEITGHWPHWVRVDFEARENHLFKEAMKQTMAFEDGTYELVGPKISGRGNPNPEKLQYHHLLPHGKDIVTPTRTWDGLIDFLSNHDIEGIVFHHSDGRMCKIRKSDFGIKR